MLERLMEIQIIDLEIEVLETEAALIPKQMDELDTQIDIHLHNVEIGRAKLIELEKERDGLELDLESKTETMHKWETQLFSIKTNKEYQAMLVEIGSVKTDISLLEDRILELMDEVDRAIETRRKYEHDLEQARTDTEEQKKQLQAELDRLQTKIAQLREQRDPLVPTDETDLYDLYSRIRNAKKGSPAVVPLDGTTCSACHMEVPPQMINEIIANEKVLTCTCSRILYYPENYPSAPNVWTREKPDQS